MLEETRDLSISTEATDRRMETAETYLEMYDDLETQQDAQASGSQTNSFHDDGSPAAGESRRPVLILYAQDNDQFTLYSVQAMEVDRLFQNCAPDELVSIVRRLIESGEYIGHVQQQDASANGKAKLNKLNVDDVASHQKLSQRELQIVTMLGAGKSVGAIAVELGLSVKTISTYRTRALEKMSLKTNADLIRYVIEHDLWVSPEKPDT